MMERKDGCLGVKKEAGERCPRYDIMSICEIGTNLWPQRDAFMRVDLRRVTRGWGTTVSSGVVGASESCDGRVVPRAPTRMRGTVSGTSRVEADEKREP